MKRKFVHDKISIRELLFSKHCLSNMFLLFHFSFLSFKCSISTFYVSLMFPKRGKKVVFKSIPHILYPYLNVEIGNNVIMGYNITLQTVKGSKIKIGDNVTINDNCFITSLFGIEIGSGTSIAENVSIRDFNHIFREKGVRLKEQGLEGDNIVIGENCWLCRGCVILPGVTIGEGAVIAANAVVNKDVPPHTVVGGVPAKIIKTIQ